MSRVRKTESEKKNLMNKSARTFVSPDGSFPTSGVHSGLCEIT